MAPPFSRLVSCCLVVANSEDCLPRWFRWALPRFQELVVLRSRSEDATDRIVAAQVAANPGRIRDSFREIDDIASQKQRCVQRATRPWRLVVDADEVVEEADWDALVQGLERQGIDLLVLPRYNLQVDDQHYSTRTYPDLQARLFNSRVRFSAEPRFQVHHKMEGARRGMTATDVHILHWGHIRSVDQLAWKSRMRVQYADTDYVEGKELKAHENWFAERNEALDKEIAPLPPKTALFIRELEGR